MKMAKTDEELHNECINCFVELANSMTKEGTGSNVVSAGLMTASAVFATFVAAGNKGGLTESGIEKLVEAYKFQIEQVQDAKKARNERRSGA
jgi:hypothetical protein